MWPLWWSHCPCLLFECVLVTSWDKCCQVCSAAIEVSSGYFMLSCWLDRVPNSLQYSASSAQHHFLFAEVSVRDSYRWGVRTSLVLAGVHSPAHARGFLEPQESVGSFRSPRCLLASLLLAPAVSTAFPLAADCFHWMPSVPSRANFVRPDEDKPWGWALGGAPNPPAPSVTARLLGFRDAVELGRRGRDSGWSTTKPTFLLEIQAFSWSVLQGWL